MPDIQKFNTGTDSTYGENLELHASIRRGIAASNAERNFRQLTIQKPLTRNSGKKLKIWRKLHTYDRALSDPDFGAKGFLTSRDLETFTNDIIANSGLNEADGRKNIIGITNMVIEAEVKRFGKMIPYSDEVDLFSSTYNSKDFREELGYYMGELYEDLVQGDMLSTSNVLYPSIATSMATIGDGVAADGTTDGVYKLDYEFLKRCVAKLLRNRVKKHTEMITGSTAVNTKPVNDAYYCVIPQQLIGDIQEIIRVSSNDKETQFAFVPVSEYPASQQAKAAKGEIGRIGEVAFISSERMFIYAGKGADVPAGYTGRLSNTNGKFDVFPILFVGVGAFATVGLMGRENIVYHSRTPEQAISNENPYGTNGFHSANFWYGGMIVKEEAILKGLVLGSSTN